MAERRAIKSKIWEDEFFGNLSPMAMLVWIGLFSRMADDQGRLLDNPNLISSQVFPYKGIPTDEIEACLNEIGDRLIRYEANGRRFIQIVRWWENQPMQYATPSNYPPPPGWVDKYRTNYKGRYIVFNWDGKDTPDTEIGTLLFNKLISLGRVSTWTDILGTLNHNPNPNPNPDIDKGKRSSNPPDKSLTTPEERIYCAVTNHPTIPAGSINEVINAIQKIKAAKSLDDNGMVAYLRPYFQAAKKRYTNSVGLFWLTDWAVIGVIPEPARQNGNGNGHNGTPAPQMRTITDVNGNSMQVPA